MTHRALVDPAIFTRLVALRHALHREPELAFHEERTAARLTDALGEIPGVHCERVARTGVVARIPGRGRGPAVAVRGDIDALPIQEETGAPFASVHEGVMHACGHDVHAAWTVGAAHLLAARPAAGDVVILLQPAEEIGGGAPEVLRAGVLDEVAAIVGGHVDMRFDVGEVVAQTGPVNGSTDEFTIDVVGRGGHAARPHDARDPIVAAAAIVTALQTIVARELAPGEPGVVTVGVVRAGSARNVIPERARLEGTVRATRPATRETLIARVRAIAEFTARAHGVTADVTIVPGTPPIVNLEEPIGWARAAITDLLGAGALRTLPEPNLGGEDFAWYLERIPGCFLRFGARAPGGETIPAHTSRFLPDDGAIAVGAAVLAETARRATEAMGNP